MREVVVVSAVRSAVGKAPRGALKDTRPDELLGLALLAEPQALDPVQLEGRRQVVDLRDVDVLRTDPGLLVGRGADGGRRSC